MFRYRLNTIFVLLSATVGACATHPVQVVDLAKGSSATAVLSIECNAACESVIEKEFKYGKRYLDNGISPAMLYEVNGTQGSQTWRCADCAVTVVNAFNDSWSGGYKVIVPAGATTLVVTANDYRVMHKTKYRVAFPAVEGRVYSLVQVQRNPLENENAWMPIIVDTIEKRVVYPTDRNRWLVR